MNKTIVCLLLASVFFSAYGNLLLQPENEGDGNNPADDVGNITGDETGVNLGDKTAELISFNAEDAGDSSADVQFIGDVKKKFGSTTDDLVPSSIGGYGNIASDATGGLIGRGLVTSSDTLKTTLSVISG